jgi:hypothetical protein
MTIRDEQMFSYDPAGDVTKEARGRKNREFATKMAPNERVVNATSDRYGHLLTGLERSPQIMAPLVSSGRD